MRNAAAWGIHHHAATAGIMQGNAAAVALSPPTGWTGYYKATLAASTSDDKFTDLGVTPVTNGGSIRQWSNQSGSNHMLQATAGNRPVYNTALTLNGYAGVRFDGVSQKLQAASLSSDPFTMVIVGRGIDPDPVGVNGRLAGCGGERSYVNGLSTQYNIYRTAASSTDLGIAYTTNAATILRFEAGVSRVGRINGADTPAFTPFVGSTVTAFTLGARSDSGGDEEGSCILYEALYYPYIISAAELTALETYLRAKFATW